MQLTPLEALNGTFSVFQILLVSVLLRGGGWKRPTLFVSGLLFLLNGLLGLVDLAGILASPHLHGGGAFVQADHWRARWVPILDEPTNLLLAVLGILLFQPRFEHEARWPKPFSRAMVGLALFAVAHSALRLSVPPSDFEQWPVFQLLVHDLPLDLGYALLLVAVGHRFINSAGEADARTSMLLLLGWGARPVQFAVLQAPILEWPRGIGFDQAFQAGHFILLVAAVAVVVRTTAASLRADGTPHLRSLWWAPVALATSMVVLAAALLLVPQNPAAYNAVQLTTLLVLRPILVGVAYRQEATLRLLLRTGTWAASLGVVKLLFATSLGYPFLAVHPWDLVALPLGLLLAVGIDRSLLRLEHAVRKRWRDLEEARDAERGLRSLGFDLRGRLDALERDLGASTTRLLDLEGSLRQGADGVAQGQTPASRVLRVLLESHRGDPDREWSAAELAGTAGITRAGNVHREIEVLRARLVERSGGRASAKDLLPRRTALSSRGYRYRLTPLGAESAEELLDGGAGGEAEEPQPVA